MARGLNKVMIIGNLGADPEMKYTQSGEGVSHIRVATSESWKDKQTGERQEKTEWHRIVLFKRLAEISSQYLKKGSKVFIEGSLRTNKWQDKNGQDRYSTDIVASNMQLMDSKQNDNINGSDDNDNFNVGNTELDKNKISTDLANAFDDIPF